MNLKIGDKVRFLNSVGGGIVVRFIGKEQVGVEDQDGFEIPALTRECVLIQDNISPIHKAFAEAGTASGNEYASSTAKGFNNTVTAKENNKSLPSFDSESFEAKHTQYSRETYEGEQLNLTLAFVPTQPKQFSTSSLEAYFINESNYWILLSIARSNESGSTLLYAGKIEPHTQIFIEDVERTDLNSFERIQIQAIAFKPVKAYSIKPPYHVDLRIDTTKFYKLHAFRENDYFQEDALLFPIVIKDEPTQPVTIDPLKLEQAMQAAIHEKEDRPRSKPLPQKKYENGTLEIDLHIPALLDDFKGMSNTEILKFQLQHFNDTMQQFVRVPNQRIVFIHGKGDGILRKALIEELKKNYSRCLWQDASFREYGFGATLVIIK